MPGITLSGVKLLQGNEYDGLHFCSRGHVSLSKVTADDNRDNDVDGHSDGSILLPCASLTDNRAYGWRLGSLGLVTFKGVSALGKWSTASSTAPRRS